MKVSVALFTYNHEKFIHQAIDSVLMQDVDFEYEIVIGEDCSTDRTRDIVIDYQSRCPATIRLVLQEKNTGGKRNWIQTQQACQGEYIALLEGDDYWTSPHKLQKQVDFLDSHPECALCFHPVWKVYEDGLREPTVIPQQRKPIYRLKDLLEGNFIPTCSTMFRSGLFGDFPDWYYTLQIGDWPLHVLNAQHGDIGCIDEVMGVYRIHGAGRTSTRMPAERLQLYVSFYNNMNKYFDFRFKRTINRSMVKQWEITADMLARTGFEQGALEAARSSLMQTFARWPTRLPPPGPWKSRVMGRMYALFAFAGHKAGDRGNVRYCLPRAVGHDPMLLGNLGIWSIGLEALLGRRVAGWLRHLARRCRLSKS